MAERRTGTVDVDPADVEAEGTGVPARAAVARGVGARPEVVLVPASNLTLALGFAALRVLLVAVLVVGGGVGAVVITGVATPPPLKEGTGDTAIGVAGSTDPPGESWPRCVESALPDVLL